MLTNQQQEHLDEIIKTFSEGYRVKYLTGAIEHKGFLGDMPAIELAMNILEEAMDQVGYAVTLIEKLRYAEE